MAFQVVLLTDTPVYSEIYVPTVPQLQLMGAPRSQSSQVGDVWEADNGNSTRNIQPAQYYDYEDVEELLGYIVTYEMTLELPFTLFFGFPFTVVNIRFSPLD